MYIAIHFFLPVDEESAKKPRFNPPSIDQGKDEGSGVDYPVFNSKQDESKTGNASEAPTEVGSSAIPENTSASFSAVDDDSAAAAGTKKTLDFPAKLMDLLQKGVAPDAIWFLPEGKAIGLNKEKFAEKVCLLIKFTLIKCQIHCLPGMYAL